jgi:hypothetical protein
VKAESGCPARIAAADPGQRQRSGADLGQAAAARAVGDQARQGQPEAVGIEDAIAVDGDLVGDIEAGALGLQGRAGRHGQLARSQRLAGADADPPGIEEGAAHIAAGASEREGASADLGEAASA